MIPASHPGYEAARLGIAGTSMEAVLEGWPAARWRRGMEWVYGAYRASDASSAVDVRLVAGFLADESYWSPGIPAETVRRAIRNSLCLSVFYGDEQVGFCRIVTDHATFAYLCDLFVLAEHRGRGVGRWLTELAVAHPRVSGVRRFVLATSDAHDLYRTAGFRELARPEHLMEILHHPRDLYGGQGDRLADP